MKFLSQIFDFMFAPAGTFDSDSGLWDASNDAHFNNDHVSHSSVPVFNPATNLPMIEDAGIDIAGSPFGMDIHHNDFSCANDASMFNHDCSSMFDNDSSFGNGSMFD
jgi:hypothetical protein